MNYQNRWLALIGICLLTFVAFLDFTIVNTALPFIQQEFQVSVIQLQWVTNIGALLLSMTMVICGRLADVFGRKKIFYLGILVFAIGAIGAALSYNFAMLIFSRGFQAIGASIAFIVASSMLSQLFPEEEQTKAVGVYTTLTGAGLAIGPFLGGLIINWLSWRWIFWANIPFIVVGFYFSLRYLPDFPKMAIKIKLDLQGAALLIASLGLLVYGIILAGQGNTWIDDHYWIIIIAGVLLFGLFYLTELKTEHPIVDFSIFKHKLVLLSMLNCIVSGVTCFGLLFFDPLYLKLIYEYPPMVIGIILVVPPVMQLIASFSFAKIMQYCRLQTILLASISIGFLACLFHAIFGAMIHSSLIILLIGLLFIGISWGLTNPTSIMAASRSVKAENMGAALGSIFTLWNISGSIFLAVGSVILHNHERLSILSGLTEFKNISSTILQQLINLALNERTDINQQVLALVGSDNITIVLNLFKQAFIHGFYLTSLFFTVVTLIILFISAGLCIHKNNK